MPSTQRCSNSHQPHSGKAEHNPQEVTPEHLLEDNVNGMRLVAGSGVVLCSVLISIGTMGVVCTYVVIAVVVLVVVVLEHGSVGMESWQGPGTSVLLVELRDTLEHGEAVVASSHGSCTSASLGRSLPARNLLNLCSLRDS